MSKTLTLDQIFAAPDMSEREVEVPEWGGSVKVRSFSKARQQQIRRDAMVNGVLDTERVEMLMFIHGVTEPAMTTEHYEALREKSAAAIDRVLQAILGISGLNEDSAQVAETTFR